MNIQELVSDLTRSNQGGLATTNESERDGNSNDLLFRIDQATVNVQGGTTFTNISPFTAVSDLLSGKVTSWGLLWLAIFGGVAYWLLKK